MFQQDNVMFSQTSVMIFHLCEYNMSSADKAYSTGNLLNTSHIIRPILKIKATVHRKTQSQFGSLGFYLR